MSTLRDFCLHCEQPIEFTEFNGWVHSYSARPECPRQYAQPLFRNPK